MFNKAQAMSLLVSIQLFRISEMPEINYNIRLKLSNKPKCCLYQIKKATSVLLIIQCIKTKYIHWIMRRTEVWMVLSV